LLAATSSTVIKSSKSSFLSMPLFANSGIVVIELSKN